MCLWEAVREEEAVVAAVQLMVIHRQRWMGICDVRLVRKVRVEVAAAAVEAEWSPSNSYQDLEVEVVVGAAAAAVVGAHQRRMMLRYSL